MQTQNIIIFAVCCLLAVTLSSLNVRKLLMVNAKQSYKARVGRTAALERAWAARKGDAGIW